MHGLFRKIRDEEGLTAVLIEYPKILSPSQDSRHWPQNPGELAQKLAAHWRQIGRKHS